MKQEAAQQRRKPPRESSDFQSEEHFKQTVDVGPPLTHLADAARELYKLARSSGTSTACSWSASRGTTSRVRS